MRRCIKLCLLLPVLLLALCACRNAADMEWVLDLPEPNPALEAQPEAVSYPMAEVDQTISILVPGEEGMYEVLTRADEYIGIPAAYEFVPWSGLSGVFTTMAESGDFTDLFYGRQMISIYTYLDYGDEIALDMTDAISRCAPNYLAAIKANPILSQVAFDGEYGEMFSFYQLTQGEGSISYGPIIRADWLEELGMEAPDTYEDYHEVLLAFRDQYACSEPLALQPTGAMSGDWLAAGYGIPAYTSGSDMATIGFYIDDGVVKYGPAQEGFRDYLAMLRQWYDEDLFSSDFVTWSDLAGYEKMVINGQTGLFYSSLDRGFALEKNITGGGRLAAIPDAMRSEGQVSHLGSQSNASTAGKSFSVFAGTTKADLCVRWCDFWYTELGTQLRNYGTEEPIDPAEIDQTKLCSFLPGFVDQQLRFLTMEEPVRAIVDTWQQNRDNDARLPSDLVLSEADQQHFAVLAQGLTTAVTIYTTKVIVGDESLESWESYLQQLNDYGLQKCLDCLNTYLQR